MMTCTILIPKIKRVLKELGVNLIRQYDDNIESLPEDKSDIILRCDKFTATVHPCAYFNSTKVSDLGEKINDLVENFQRLVRGIDIHDHNGQ